MKHFLFLCSLALLCAALLPEAARAQKQNIWKGGQAGRATDWNCPRNWSLGRVPDWTCAAVIEQDCRSVPLYPVISVAAEAVQYLLLLPGARLEIGPKGRLEIELIEACLFEGQLLNRGQLMSEGNALAAAKPLAAIR